MPFPRVFCFISFCLLGWMVFGCRRAVRPLFLFFYMRDAVIPREGGGARTGGLSVWCCCVFLSLCLFLSCAAFQCCWQKEAVHAPDTRKKWGQRCDNGEKREDGHFFAKQQKRALRKKKEKVVRRVPEPECIFSPCARKKSTEGRQKSRPMAVATSPESADSVWPVIEMNAEKKSHRKRWHIQCRNVCARV